MYFDPRINNHNLPHDPFNALVMPRPIGWISTISRDGVVNLAPYSYFNAVANRPPCVMFASAGRKDSQRNAEETGEFVANLATFELRDQMNATSATMPADVSEPQVVGLEMTASVAVKPPRVARSPVALECKYVKTVDLPGLDGKPHSTSIVIGQVVGIFVDDSVIVNGEVDVNRMQPIGRLGYLELYCVVNSNSVFRLKRPA